MHCWHGRYNLGDPKAPYPKADDIMLPLYLYDHSGLTISTTPFSCPWDSGKVGLIYVSREKAREEYGVKRLSDKLLSTVLYRLRDEVEEYDRYLRGESYMYVIKDEDGEIKESCSGYDDIEYCKREIADQIDSWNSG